MNSKNEFMLRTIQLAEENVANGGLPFSTVITKDNIIIAESVNSVHISFDPSDHAEISAIRKATSSLRTSDLSGCDLYVVGMPCPMCLTCIILSKISSVIFAVDIPTKDACLTKLHSTDQLYNVINNGHGKNLISFEHLTEFSDRGSQALTNWNFKQLS